LGLAGIGLAGLCLLHWHERRRVKQMRAAFFTDCMALFPRCRVLQDRFDYPILEGRYHGFDIRLEPVLENPGFDKLALGAKSRIPLFEWGSFNQ